MSRKVRFGIAPQQLVALPERADAKNLYFQDVQSVLDWFCVKPLGDRFVLPAYPHRPYLENFSPSFEAYLTHSPP